jgi:prepilin-type processing-associated H-X9-DG protein
MRRRGFTLFHLLLILAILAILLGLLLPAIQKVREAAARAQSANNLHQIAIAVHTYHDANGSFPPGIDGKNYSAFARLLPYIEQDNLYKKIDFTKEMTDKGNDEVRAVVIKTFLAPIDPVESVKKDHAPTNYLFSAGSKASLESNDGVFYLDSATKLTDIKDGTSNTIMAGETLKGDGGEKAVTVKRQHVRLKKDALKDLADDAGVKDWKDGKHIAGDRGASWMDGRFLQGTFASNRAINDEKPDVDCGGAGGLSGLRTLMATTNVAFCDGSVHSLSTGVKLDVLKALATRDGGEVINDGDF